MERDPEDKADLIKYQIESAWNLSQWQVVEESCPQTTSTDWQTNLGKSLLLAKNDDENGLHEHVAILRKDLMIPVAAAAMEQGSYRRSYDYLIKLQVLDEIETLSSLKDITEETIEKIFAEWKTRLTFSQYSLSTLEPVLKVRRALVEMAINRKQNEAVKVKLKTELSHCWLMSAKVARKAGQLNKAYNLLLEAQQFSHKEVFIESAKLSWARDCKTEAITILEKGIADQFPTLKFGFEKSKMGEYKPEALEVCGKAKLLLARYVYF